MSSFKIVCLREIKQAFGNSISIAILDRIIDNKLKLSIWMVIWTCVKNQQINMTSNHRRSANRGKH
ncbi:hypothetical protein PAXY110619_30890 [Paenibacillus xylanexedens]|uniref:Uncharacterized protein n=1 Tax=Paenibacillus xylanexedens TaxID=528191 RepID=A0ABS4RLT7_PAEXY|nr:hypothetical protein [Paenibacillus xylanexedens]